MSGIFVNYRQNRRTADGQSDLRAHAQAVEAIAERLRQHFGTAAVFLDTGLRAATRYPDELRKRLDSSELVVAVIHREWLADLRDREGGLDWVHHELATAVAAGKPVLPVLLAGARLPEAGELPAELAELAKCQAHPIRFGQWEHGVRALIETAETYISPDPLPAPEPAPTPRGRSRLGIPIAWLTGAVVAVLPVYLAFANPVDRMVWWTLLAIALATMLALGVGTAGVVYAVRKPIDRIASAWAKHPGDEKTNVVVGTTIAGLALIVLLTGDIPAELQVLTLCVIAMVVVVLGTQWINHRESALAWPRPWLPASPISIRAELARVRVHLARPAPLSRADRDKADYALGQIAACVDTLRDVNTAPLLTWLLASSPLVTLPHAAFLGAAVGASTAALTGSMIAWATGSLIVSVACYLGAIAVTHRLARWRGRVVLDTAPAEVDALRGLLRELSH